MEQVIERLRQQQALLAAFGSFAFRETDLLLILNEAARVCATSLGVERAKICQYRAVENDLLVVAGYGWHTGVVGRVVSKADESTPQGRAYVTGQPVICKNLAEVDDFKLPDFYAEHNVVSTVDVIIKGLDGPPFGILEIDNTTQHDYYEYDVDFLTGFANVLAEAVGTASRVERLRNMVAEKDQLLVERAVLAKELQHRVRNNLQLISGMLAEQRKRMSDPSAQMGLRGVQSRITALARVYDHLLGVGLTRQIDFSEYVRLLCQGLPDLRPDGSGPIELTCNVTSMVLDLDTVTALGLVVTELVANSYEHAFPARAGRIAVVGGLAKQSHWAELQISDDGVGYVKTSAESKRHGVGLVYRLMQQVSGSVAVQVDQGTTWTLKIPLPASEEVSAA